MTQSPRSYMILSLLPPRSVYTECLYMYIVSGQYILFTQIRNKVFSEVYHALFYLTAQTDKFNSILFNSQKYSESCGGCLHEQIERTPNVQVVCRPIELFTDRFETFKYNDYFLPFSTGLVKKMSLIQINALQTDTCQLCVLFSF